MRTFIEVVHILIGLAAAYAMTELSMWAYPLGRTVIWWCGAAAMIATIAMGIGPLMRALAIDRARMTR